MHFAIGTTNRPKSLAIEYVLTHSPYTEWATFSGHKVPSWVPDMPTTLEEIRTWAKNRAINTRREMLDADYFVGMEWWVYQDCEWENYWLVWVVYIEDREGKWHYGYSCHLEVPERVVEGLFDGHHRTLAHVMTELGEDDDIAEKSWSFGVFTDDMIPRSESFIQATKSALAPHFNAYYAK